VFTSVADITLEFLDILGTEFAFFRVRSQDLVVFVVATDVIAQARDTVD